MSHSSKLIESKEEVIRMSIHSQLLRITGDDLQLMTEIPFYIWVDRAHIELNSRVPTCFTVKLPGVGKTPTHLVPEALY